MRASLPWSTSCRSRPVGSVLESGVQQFGLISFSLCSLLASWSDSLFARRCASPAPELFSLACVAEQQKQGALSDERVIAVHTRLKPEFARHRLAVLSTSASSTNRCSSRNLCTHSTNSRSRSRAAASRDFQSWLLEMSRSSNSVWNI